MGRHPLLERGQASKHSKAMLPLLRIIDWAVADALQAGYCSSIRSVRAARSGSGAFGAEDHDSMLLTDLRLFLRDLLQHFRLLASLA